jgi:NADPH:quinone reductase-like Zn-dependent oxidoreductase
MKIKAIRIYETGGPEVLRYEDIELPEPGPGQARVRHRAIGVNFIDIYMCEGIYPLKLPAVPGVEAAGIVEAVGPGVTGFAPGARVAYAMLPGAYADAANVPADRLVVLPATIDDEAAAAILLKGMTAEYLLRRAYPVARGESILVHAAAGGVGLLLCQWASHLGANVIGTVSTPAKAALARENGCAHVFLADKDDIAGEVRARTDGKGVRVVYDSVGQSTFTQSLDCLAPRGTLVSFGNSSGPVTGIDLSQLARGSFYVTRPGLGHYIATRADLEGSAAALFDVVAKGVVKVQINQRYRLADAAQAHRDLKERRTTGASILIP